MFVSIENILVNPYLDSSFSVNDYSKLFAPPENSSKISILGSDSRESTFNHRYQV